MFSQRKKKSNWVLYTLIVIFVGLVLALIFLPEDNASNEGNAKIDPGTDYTDNLVDDPYGEPGEEGDNLQSEDGTPAAGDEIEKQESYYLIKNDNNSIKVYFCDQQGKMTELETTAIIYETLSEADQQMFDQGVRIASRDELFKLLQDFES